MVKDNNNKESSEKSVLTTDSYFRSALDASDFFKRKDRSREVETGEVV